MPKLPRVNAREVVNALHRGGFVDDRQKGSHLTVVHPERGCRVVVPMHPGDLTTGLLHDMLKQAGLTVEEFGHLLK